MHVVVLLAVSRITSSYWMENIGYSRSVPPCMMWIWLIVMKNKKSYSTFLD